MKVVLFTEGGPVIEVVPTRLPPEIPVQEMVSIRGRLFADHAEPAIAL